MSEKAAPRIFVFHRRGAFSFASTGVLTPGIGARDIRMAGGSSSRGQQKEIGTLNSSDGVLAILDLFDFARWLCKQSLLANQSP